VTKYVIKRRDQRPEIDLGPVQATFHAGSPETSSEAAYDAALTRDAVAMNMLAEYESAEDGLTADEVSLAVGKSILYGRPVVTRLKKSGYLEVRKNSSGKSITRTNAVSGKRACVLVITDKGRGLL
jgi:hypothetical protein